MNYQLLHGDDLLRWWQPENDREAHLICEMIDLRKKIDDGDEEWQKKVDDLDDEITKLQTDLESEREVTENQKNEIEALEDRVDELEDEIKSLS